MTGEVKKNVSKGLVNELRKRNVFKVALGYLIAAWLVAQVADLVLESFDAPDWVMRYLLVALAIGFPIALIISWVFEITPKGVVPESRVDRTVRLGQESGRRLDFSILLILSIVIVFMGLERFVFSDRDGGRPERPALEDYAKPGDAVAPPSNATTTEKPPAPAAMDLSKSVAVLPFAAMSTGPDDDYFADGLTEEIINALSQLPQLMVTARTSAFHFKGENIPVGEIAGQLGVDHIVEGSIRRAGDQLRITAQLVRTEDGFHLWSETYDRRTEDTFAVQDDIAAQVAKALNVVLDDDQRKSMRSVGVRNVDAFVAYQKGNDLYNRAHQEANQISLLRQANEYFETAIGFYPEFSDAYIQHSDLYSHILINQAAGTLDGEITQADINSAPALLQQDIQNAVRYARDESQKLAIELDSAFLMGNWRGLRDRSELSLRASGCETALWAQLTGAAFGNAALTREAFRRNIICDPLLIRGDVHLTQSLLLLGEWSEAATFAKQKLDRNNSKHPWLIRSLAIAQAMQGDFAAAKTTIRQLTIEEDDRLFGLATVAALGGNARAAEGYSQQYLGQFGPQDEYALRLEAMRGNRNEANRLATQMDSRPFGYITLMQSIYDCACGAPFDLEAAPVFADMLKDSGLEWPPVSPVRFPLKGW